MLSPFSALTLLLCVPRIVWHVQFQDVLRYFGEDPELTPMAFFTTLGSFLKVL